MLLRELFEATKTAAFAFGRMNPPTIGHKKLADAVAAQEGDAFIFLSQSQKPKTDPLDFPTKVKLAQAFFPNVKVGDANVKTIIQALQKVESMGYTDIIYAAGSDRIEDFTTLINKYNGKEYNFNSIKVVSAGERDPDADGAEGMSASKMRAAAASSDFESFAQGVPNKKLAKTMYDAVRNGMGVKDQEPVEDMDPEEEDEFHVDLDKLVHEYFGHSSDEKKKEVDETGIVNKRSMAGDTKTHRYTATGARIPTSDTSKDKDITKVSKQTDFPDDSYTSDTDDKIDQERLKKTVAAQIDTITNPKDKKVIQARFGLGPFKQAYTLKQIADAMGVTPEVIRQREARAIRQLKHPSRSRELRQFLDHMEEKAPPGREKQVKALKKKFDDPGAPYAIAWAQHNKKKK